MAGFDVNIDGLDGHLRRLDDLAKRTDAAAGNVMLDLAQRVADQAIHEITGHARSSPGTPPAGRTGNLADSIVAKADGKTAAKVESDATYSKHLELGTRKMKAHPFMALAVGLIAPDYPVAEQFDAQIRAAKPGAEGVS